MILQGMNTFPFQEDKYNEKDINSIYNAVIKRITKDYIEKINSMSFEEVAKYTIKRFNQRIKR